ncbi:zinc ribbon domain-containing protein [Cohnella caldifontis]|uniref:zinc ribbon domain-containing protein n=1 Tax=Cohnella caldifontis TaxID=3027471 RepID=UPI0023EE05E9|nr:zinc ribbon domain-containing protein [Cohnella sp. YIM B05605]
MKSIKPGRGPSAMGAVGSVAVGIFGIFWTIMAANMGAPIFFVFFGIVFVGIAVMQGIYHFKNATGTRRMSLFDITDSRDEPDPVDVFLAKSESMKRDSAHGHGADNENGMNYCPYCGNPVQEEAYRYCPKCGKELA